MKTPIWLLAVALGAAGCGGSMMSNPEQMQSMIDDTRAENHAHRDAASTTDSLASMRDEMVRHRGTMSGMMDDMGAAMDGMMDCAGPGMGDLRGMHDAMNGEMNHHAATMDSETSLGPANAEVLRHAGVVDGMLDTMDDAIGRMGCPM